MRTICNMKRFFKIFGYQKLTMYKSTSWSLNQAIKKTTWQAYFFLDTKSRLTALLRVHKKKKSGSDFGNKN